MFLIGAQAPRTRWLQSPGMDTPDPQDRFHELAERAARGDLSEPDRQELDRIVSTDPNAAEQLHAIHKETAMMQSAATNVIDHFDFERARRAITQRDRLHRSALRTMLITIGLCAFGWAVFGRSGGWPLLLWIVGLPLLPVLLWTLANVTRRLHERRLLLAKGETVFPALFESTRKRTMNEFRLVQAGIILVTVGMVTLIIEAVLTGAYAKAVVAGVMLALLWFSAGHRIFGKGASSRAERFAEGELTAEEFARGKDESRA